MATKGSSLDFIILMRRKSSEKIVGLVLTVLVISLTGCGNKAMEDLQTNYDRLSSQYDNL